MNMPEYQGFFDSIEDTRKDLIPYGTLPEGFQKDVWTMAFSDADPWENHHMRVHTLYRAVRFVLLASNEISTSEMLSLGHFRKPLKPPANYKEVHQLFPITLEVDKERSRDLFELMVWACEKSGADRGTKKFPLMFHWCMKGISGKHFYQYMPTPAEFTTYENQMIDEVGDKFFDGGQVAVIRDMRELGFSDYESASLLQMSRSRSRIFYEADVENARSTHVMRLEAALIRAQRALDLRAELAVLKMIAQTYGLDKVAPTDDLTEMVDIIKNLAPQTRNFTKEQATDVEFE